MDPALIKKAIEALFRDTMRCAAFHKQRRPVRQIVGDSSEAPFSMHDLSAVPRPEQPAAIERLAAEIQTSLNTRRARRTDRPDEVERYVESSAGRDSSPCR